MWADPAKPSTFIPGYREGDVERYGLSLTREQVAWCIGNPPNLLFGNPTMHDKNGKPLKVGDLVMVPCTVKHVQAGDYCTLTLETTEIMPGNRAKTSISLNAKQVEYVGPGVDPGVEAKLAAGRAETPPKGDLGSE